MNPKIAVITRTKNRKLLLKRALTSVANQSYKNYIHIIVNDGGDSINAIDILSHLSPDQKRQVAIINLPISKGMEAASNIGIHSTNSEYITIHDDDDSWETDFLKKTTEFLDENPTSMGVITHTYFVYEYIYNNSLFIENSAPGFSGAYISLIEMCKINLFPPIAFLFRRSALEKIGYFNEKLMVLGDWDFNLRFLQQYEIDVIKEPLANYHHRMKSTGIMGNSVIENIQSHQYHRNLIKNQYLRKGLIENKIDLGLLLNLFNDLPTPKTTKQKLKNLLNKIIRLKKVDYHAKHLQKTFHDI